MKKDDYRSEFEEHRQKIKLDEEPTVIKSRAELYKKKRNSNKKPKHMMINVIFGMFIIIIVFVVINWYIDTDKTTTAAQDSRVKYETRTNKTNEIKPEDNNIVNDEKDDEKITEAPPKEEPKKTERNRQEDSSSKSVDKSNNAEKNEEKAEAKDNIQEEKKTVAKVEEKAEEKPVEKPAMKTHTVMAGETIYSISVVHYQSGNGVEKIKQANGLTSNEIYVGQVLTIP
ncbi:LysM peptidoglycan-binding domain-containing protein [Sporosarcina jiandibaonis]|uniref:LysM peptidoglycan-binding domain-containing protein n=1 Tax=Sporosarcina jiandibaonis TaxID=2715535 RepID=UPI0015539932|nr:LysM peptidoglycan-binding domain-containing protein [Sporosarcina jiandibaonis]